MLDIFSIYFLVKFTKKPLRFFGILGSSLFAVGVLILLYLLFIRLFQGVDWPTARSFWWNPPGRSRRPGIRDRIAAEIIIFTHAKDIKEYTIDQIIN